MRARLVLLLHRCAEMREEGYKPLSRHSTTPLPSLEHRDCSPLCTSHGVGSHLAPLCTGRGSRPNTQERVGHLPCRNPAVGALLLHARLLGGVLLLRVGIPLCAPRRAKWFYVASRKGLSVRTLVFGPLKFCLMEKLIQ